MNALMERRLTCITLSGLFTLGMGIASLTAKNRGTPRDMVELGLAVFRLGRMVSYDQVFEPYRSFFCKTVPDSTGAGDTVAAKYPQGWKSAIGDLICCPICAGTWISALLSVGMAFFPRMTRFFLDALCAVGAAEILNALTEYFQWTGEVEREHKGYLQRVREETDGR